MRNTATKAAVESWSTPPAGFDPAAGRVVRTDPPSVPRAVVFRSGPIGPGGRKWMLAFGWRPDLARQFDIVPVRFGLEVTRRIDLISRAERRPAQSHWSFRLRSDFHLIESRIAYRWVARALVAKLVGPNPSTWRYHDHEARLEGVAWAAEEPTLAATALRGVEALRGVMAEKGIPDRFGRMYRRGFFG